MFVREKRINGYTYLYLVESVREHGRAKQRIIKNLGRKEAVVASGELERLASSVARYAERTVILSQLAAGNPDQLACTRIGAPLLFGRLWEETDCKMVVDGLLAGRGFEFAVERAVFATVLHRLMVSGSDRACEKWLADYAIPGVDGLALHQLYRAMAWLGEELAADQQAGATPFAPRTMKDLVEEQLFERRRDLFSELSVVFLDTTSLSFTGAGGKTLGERGYSKDHRPDLMQMIVGVVIDAEGRPVCSEMWPGNTADVRVLLPVIDRLRSRFAIGRVCVVADRGMISAATIAALEERGLEYVLGARERTDALVRKVVLADSRPFTPLCIQRVGGEQTQLFVKQVKVEDRRYIVCRNEAEAAKDAADRRAIVEALDQQLKRGDKALIGNSAYRRYLRTTSDLAGRRRGQGLPGGGQRRADRAGAAPQGYRRPRRRRRADGDAARPAGALHPRPVEQPCRPHRQAGRVPVLGRRLGRHHDRARAADADRARRAGRVRARPDPRPHWRGPRAGQGAWREAGAQAEAHPAPTARGDPAT